MIVLRDERRVARLKTFAKYASGVGFLILIIGLVLGFINPEEYLWLQVLALPLGWLLSQVGLYLAHRYVRDPRPDEVLDDALRKVARNSRMYHYLLPAPHVLLTRGGPIVFVAKFQAGDISVEGDRWRQKGVGILRKFFSQESLGNPTREVERDVKALAAYINKQAPEIEEVPIGALIVFTTKNAGNLDLEGSDIPAMHVTKLRGYFKEHVDRTPLPEAEYEALQMAFDEKAGDLEPVKA